MINEAGEAQAVQVVGEKLTRRKALRRMGSVVGASAVAPWLSSCDRVPVVSNAEAATGSAASSSDAASAADSSSASVSSSASSSSASSSSASSSSAAPVIPPNNPPDITTPLGRLKAFMTGVVGSPFVVPQLAAVTQQQQSNNDDPLDAGSVIYPPPTGSGVNPNPHTLMDIPQVWGYRRDTWFRGPSIVFYSNSNYGSYYQPVSQRHVAPGQTTDIAGGIHFIHTGQAFEVLFGGRFPWVTLIADGQYATNQWISTEISASGTLGPVLGYYNCFTKFDFGSVATRRISLYGMCSNVGPCAIAIGPQDTIAPWDRSLEPSFCAMTDSYGQGSNFNWSLGGPFWVAASLLGIPHIDLNAFGGTGYAPIQSAAAYASDPGNAFGPRIGDSVTAAPDLFVTGGGINDNYGYAAPPLYPTVADSNAAFTNAVVSYYQTLRAALPNSVLAAMGPWAPKQSIPTSPVAQGKLDVIRQTLQTISGPWVLIDNLNGGWLNSNGATGPQTGPWQTGTGNVGAPTGTGNGDIYVSADGTHPTPLGQEYLGRMLASNLAAGILAL